MKGSIIEQFMSNYLILDAVAFFFCLLCALDKNIDRSDHCADQRSKIDDCLKLAKKYKMGKGKWIDGDGIVGGELSISFVKDGEVISVSSSHMPDNGMEAFHAVRKVLGEAWSQGK